MRISYKDVYIMKKILSIILSLFAFSFYTPAYANDANWMMSMTTESHQLIGLPEAHKNGYTGKDQVVVVIDSGISINHETFLNKIIDGYCSSRIACGNLFMQSGVQAGSSRSLPGHTFVDEHGSMAGAIAAGLKVGNFPGGIAPDAKIIAINNQDGNSEGLILAFDWIIKMKNKYNIVAVNASFGVPGIGDRGLKDNQSSCPKFDDLNQKIKQMYDLGISFVAASGNGGAYSNVNYPACSEYAIGVGALTSKGEITNYSDIGREVDILAPADVVGAQNNFGYWFGGGTSSATPVVVGAIALLKQASPNATVDQIKKALASSGITKDDVVWGNLPVLNISKSIDAIKSNSYSYKQVSRVSSLDNTLYNKIALEKNNIETKMSIKDKEIEALKSELLLTKTELSMLKDKVKYLESDLYQVNKKSLSSQNEADSLKKQNADLISKINKICKTKKKSALCK